MDGGCKWPHEDSDYDCLLMDFTLNNLSRAETAQEMQEVIKNTIRYNSIG